MFRTGNTGTRPKSSAARERHCTTPVDPNRYNTISFKFSTRLFQVISMSGSSVLRGKGTYFFNFSSISFSPPPVGSPISIRSSRVSTNSPPSTYLIYPCFANFRRKTSDMAEQRTINLGSYILAILLIFYILSSARSKETEQWCI